MALSPVEIEGPIAAVRRDGDEAVLTVMGLEIHVTRSAFDNRRVRIPDLGQPERHLTLDQLTDTDPLPGREEAGFLGGTAIVLGNIDPAGRIEVDFDPPAPVDQGQNPFTAHPSLEVGPPESVLLGPITARSGGNFTVNGLAVRHVGAGEARLRGLPPQNEFGFELVPDSIQPGMPASVDGYPATPDPSEFLGLTFVVDDPRTRLARDEPQVSILRASGRNRGAEFDVNVRGGVYVPGVTGGAQTIEIHRVDRMGGADVERFVGRAEARMRSEGFGNWRFDGALTALAPPYDRAPSRIVVRNVTAPGAARPEARKEDIDVRDG